MQINYRSQTSIQINPELLEINEILRKDLTTGIEKLYLGNLTCWLTKIS